VRCITIANVFEYLNKKGKTSEGTHGKPPTPKPRVSDADGNAQRIPTQKKQMAKQMGKDANEK
jgi:hypothetical protein